MKDGRPQARRLLEEATSRDSPPPLAQMMLAAIYEQDAEYDNGFLFPEWIFDPHAVVVPSAAQILGQYGLASQCAGRLDDGCVPKGDLEALLGV